MDSSVYLDLNDPDGPRINGHRIWLNDVLYEHVIRRLAADELLARFPMLGMPKIYACLLYFEENKAECLRGLYDDLDRQERDHTQHAAENHRWHAALLERMLLKAGDGGRQKA